MTLNSRTILRWFLAERPDVYVPVAFLRDLYLFPTILLAKLLRIKVVYWGHGRDLQDKRNFVKNTAYMLEHLLVDAIILYGEHLKTYIPRWLHRKVFVANNTLELSMYRSVELNSTAIKAKYGIKTQKNIICMGRFERRKRVEDLVAAFARIKGKDVGLVLAGPDCDGLLAAIDSPRVYKVGPIYGTEAIQLLAACDVYCLPGAVGLSIVDAFYAGLPIVTEEGIDHGPEIMYLKPGENGFLVPKGDIEALARTLNLLLDDDALRMKLSENARRVVSTEAHISKLAQGFLAALDYVTARDREA